MKSTYMYVYAVNIVKENKPNVTTYTYPGYSDNK